MSSSSFFLGCESLMCYTVAKAFVLKLSGKDTDILVNLGLGVNIPIYFSWWTQCPWLVWDDSLCGGDLGWVRSHKVCLQCDGRVLSLTGTAISSAQLLSCQYINPRNRVVRKDTQGNGEAGSTHDLVPSMLTLPQGLGDISISLLGLTGMEWGRVISSLVHVVQMPQNGALKKMLKKSETTKEPR